MDQDRRAFFKTAGVVGALSLAGTPALAAESAAAGSTAAGKGGAGDAPVGGLERFYATVQDLRAIAVARVPPGFIAEVAGYRAAGDGGGGAFQYDPTSGARVDGGLALSPLGYSGPGRWLRRVDGRRLSPKWFGAVGGGRGVATDAVQAALDAARGIFEVDIDDTYLIDNSLVLKHSGQIITGRGTLRGAIAAFPRIAGNSPAEPGDNYGESSFSIASLNAAAGIVTATTAFPHNFRTGDTVAVFFALPDSYCGIQQVTVTGPSSFAYKVPVTPDAPAKLFGTLATRIAHPPVSDPHDPAAPSGGACFRAIGSIANVHISGITIADFRYGALLSGPEPGAASKIGSVNLLTFERVTFHNVNICGFGYPFIQGGAFLDCLYYEVNCVACGNAVCLPAGHPYAKTDTQFVDLLTLENRGQLDHRLRVNANLDLWFYRSVLRPETPSVDPAGRSIWFLAFRRGSDKMPPSQACVSGRAVYCPSRDGRYQHQASIQKFRTVGSYRSLVVFGQPSRLFMDSIGTETYAKPMPGEPCVHLIVAYDTTNGVPSHADGVLRRIENLIVEDPASKSIEIDRVKYDESGFIARAGDASWDGGEPPDDIVALDCEAPNDCAVELGNGALKAPSLTIAAQLQRALPRSQGPIVLANAIQPLASGLTELGVHRSSGSFVLGSAAEGSNRNRLQLCGPVQRVSRGVMEIMATRLDTGASDYCRLRFNLPAFVDVSPAGLGTTATALHPGDGSVAIAPGATSRQALLPGLTVRIGGNTLVVKDYDAEARRLTFYTGALAAAPAGTGIAGRGEIAIVDPFASADIFKAPRLNGAAIELETPLYPDGAPQPTPIAVTFWSTDTLHFERARAASA